MTDQLRACSTCFQRWVTTPNAYRCPECDVGRIVATAAAKHRRPKLDPTDAIAALGLTPGDP